MTILTLLMTGIVTLESMVGYVELTEIVNGLIQILNVMIDNLLSDKCGYVEKISSLDFNEKYFLRVSTSLLHMHATFFILGRLALES